MHHDTWINSVRTPDGKNIPRGGSTTSKVVTVDFQSTATDTGKGSHVDLKIDKGRWKAEASPKTITDLSVGKHTISLKGVDKNGNEDPTPAKWTFTVIKGKDSGGGYPETWINWVRATPGGVNIANGGSTTSTSVTVDFQSTATDTGIGSHVDLSIDNGSYEPVASPHTITGLSQGQHTIRLRGVTASGEVETTPATWMFTIIKDDEPQQQVTISDVHTEPKVLYVNDTFRIVATIMNNSTSTITYDVSPCSYHLSVTFHGSSDAVSTQPTGLACPAVAGQALLEAGKSASLTVPPSTEIYNASKAGDVGATISFLYDTVNGISQNISSSFNFTILQRQKLEPQGDEDGDGISNEWEEKGIDINNDGEVDLDLPSLGSNPYHKDVFLEIDYMEHHEPFDNSIPDLIAAFNDAPPLNPDGTNGIRLHVDLDEQIPHQDHTRWDIEFPIIKSEYFGTTEERSDPNADNLLFAKQDIYHYAVFGHSGGTWGCQWQQNCRNIFFTDSRGGGPHPTGTEFSQPAALMHELGHNFGLFHGGFEAEKDVDNKANYLSLMHALFLYGVPLLDYSGCELLPLDENNLNEQEGVGTSCPPGRLTGYFHEGAFYTTQTGVPVDWNHDGDFNDTGVIADINGDGKLTILHGHDDWSKLKFGKFITASTASSSEQLQQNQTMAAESLEFKKPDHFHDFLNEARESRKMQMDAIEHAIESFINLSSSNTTTTAAEEEEQQQVREANMLMEDVHEASSLVESDRLDNATARLEVIKEKVSAWNIDSTESESQRRTIISLIDNVIESFEKTGTPAPSSSSEIPQTQEEAPKNFSQAEDEAS